MKECNFTKGNTSPGVLFTFMKLYKLSQIAQRMTYVKKIDGRLSFSFRLSVLAKCLKISLISLLVIQWWWLLTFIHSEVSFNKWRTLVLQNFKSCSRWVTRAGIFLLKVNNRNTRTIVLVSFLLTLNKFHTLL